MRLSRAKYYKYVYKNHFSSENSQNVLWIILLNLLRRILIEVDREYVFDLTIKLINSRVRKIWSGMKNISESKWRTERITKTWRLHQPTTLWWPNTKWLEIWLTVFIVVTWKYQICPNFCPSFVWYANRHMCTSHAGFPVYGHTDSNSFRRPLTLSSLFTI